ncbi:MAG: FtsX-like permease family protein [Euryarchaeota archaeon]|nr:FtsX-like permease family protein [Euryarchaeota archaeon]MDE2046358.1 FtsX-like permease family protein [Thermoplasmata archaeon]
MTGARDREGPALPDMASEGSRRSRLAAQVLWTGVVLGVCIIAMSLWLGTSQGAQQASGGLTALGWGDPTVGLLVLLVLIVALSSVVLGVKDRVIAKIGLRNVARARTRTVVLLFGLLIGSTIISSSLVIGDTVGALSVHFTYISDGAVDEAAYAPPPPQGLSGPALWYGPLPTSVFDKANASVGRTPYLLGLTPMILGTAGAYDLTANVAQPGLTMVGVDPWASRNLGSFTTTGGSSLAGPLPGEVLLNPTSASELSASVGDRIRLSGPSASPMNFTVLGIVKADTRGGFQDAGLGDVFVALQDAQNLSGIPGSFNYLAATNTGGLVGGTSHSDDVSNSLNCTLAAATNGAGCVPGMGVSVNRVLQRDIVSAQASAQSLTQLFLVLGLFSIGAGCVLIVGIFAMLAEERRGEMGVARAVGMRRGQLIRAYYFEGLAYSAGAALLGTLLGVVVGWGIIQLFAASIGGGGGAATNAIVESFTFTPQSLVLAYAAGFLLTLGTVTLTSAYVSRMNIVRAIRSQPELVHKTRSQRAMLVLGLVLVLVGALLYLDGHAAQTDISIGFMGASMLILGGGLIAAFRVPLRRAFSASAVGLLFFWADLPLRNDLFPGTHSGTILVFFLEGVFLILSAVILYVFNSDVIVRVLTGLSRSSSRNLPVVRLAFSYPAHRKFRSAMTISIFAMVLFTITAIAAIGNGISSGVSTSITTESGGYQFYGFSESPIANITSEVTNNSTLNAEVSTLVPFYSGPGILSVQGSRNSTFGYGLAAAPTGEPGRFDFYTSNHYNFTSTLDGMSASRVWQELSTPNTNVTVVDGSFAGGAFGSFGGGPGHPGASPGDILDVQQCPGCPTFHLKVLGVLNEQTLPIVLVNPELLVNKFGYDSQSIFLFSGAPGAAPRAIIQTLQTHFFQEGLQIYDFAQILSTTLQFTDAFINLLEVFVALGLIVGITSLGILALRAVVERRTQIGVVRAVGFRRSMVLASFLTEYSFLALMGIGIGAVMGLILAYNLNQAVGGFFAFAVPWENLLTILGTSYALTLVATGLPSFRASRIAPAEAIRYSE